MKKKIIALILCAASLLALAACGGANAETAEATPEPTAEPVAEAVTEAVIEELSAEVETEPEPAPEDDGLTELDLRVYVELFDTLAVVDEDADAETVSGKDEAIAGTPLVDDTAVVRAIAADLSGVDYTKTGEYYAYYTVTIDRAAYDEAEAARLDALTADAGTETEADETEAAETIPDEDTPLAAAPDAAALPDEFNAEEVIIVKTVSILTEDEFNELAEQEGYTLTEDGLLIKANPTEEDMAAEALAELGVDIDDEDAVVETSVNAEGKTVVTVTKTDASGNTSVSEAVIDNRGNVSVTDDNGNKTVVPVVTPAPTQPTPKPTATPAPTSKPDDTPTATEKPTTTATETTKPTATPAPAATDTSKDDDDGRHTGKTKDDGSDTTSKPDDTYGPDHHYRGGDPEKWDDPDYTGPYAGRPDPDLGGPGNSNSNRNSNSDNNSNTGGNNSNTGSTPAPTPAPTPVPEPEPTPCPHNWVDVTHTEEVWVGSVLICGQCGAEFYDGNSLCDHFAETGHGSDYARDLYETVTVKDGERCTICGATR